MTALAQTTITTQNTESVLSTSTTDYIKNTISFVATFETLIARVQALEALTRNNTSPPFSSSKLSTNKPPQGQTTLVTRPVPIEVAQSQALEASTQSDALFTSSGSKPSTNEPCQPQTTPVTESEFSELAQVQVLEASTQNEAYLISNGSEPSAHEPVEDQMALTAKALPSKLDTSVPDDRSDVEVTKQASECAISGSESPEHIEIANKIIDIIESYGVHEMTNVSQPCEAKKLFLPVVLERVKKGTAVIMVLPAFPFKSPNRQGKVLGALPDFAEEIALATLQSLCDNISQVYEHGAEVVITSDGLVYNDLLNVSDHDVWTYGESLRQMAQEKKLTSIKFLRLLDLLEVAHHRSGTALHSSGSRTVDEDRIYYLTHAPCFRRELIARYEPPAFDAKKAIKEDTDTCLTYRGYLRFLRKDLQHDEALKLHQDGQPLSAKKYDKVISGIAQRMIARGAAFAAAIKETHGDLVRLSIHPTTAVTKFPVQLIPKKSGEFGHTPWHSSVAVGLDGSFTTGHAEDFAKTHDLISRDGRPYYYREKSDLFDWGDLKVEFEFLYPCGLIIRPVDGSPSARNIPMNKVRQLSVSLSPVVLRGFTETIDEPVYTDKAHEAGKVLPWTFGIIQKVKDAGVNTKMGNNVTSNEGMPMHFDGMFKFEERKDPITGEVAKVQVPPGFQFFTALATAPEGTGYTLFASSRLFFRYLRSPYNAERFEKIKWNMDNNGFWDAKLKDLPLIVRHPVTNLPCVRWHEPWDETKTKFSTCKVSLSNDDEEIVDVVTKLLYNFRVCLRFTWHVGDWLVSDNTSMLHTRTGYTTGCERELWRIHFD